MASILDLMYGQDPGATSGSADLNAFNRTLAADDYLGQAGKALNDVKFNNTWITPNQSLALTAGQSFLSSVLRELGQNDQERQLQAVTNILPDLYTNPEAAVIPEGVNSTAFNNLKANAIAKDAIRKAEVNDAITKQMSTIGGIYDPENKRVDDLPGYTDILTKREDILKKSSEASLDRMKQGLEKTTYNRITNLPAYKQLADVASNFNALPDLAKQDTVASDIGLISTIARIRDPNSTVREGEFKINSEVQSALDQIAGNWRKVVEGKSRLTNDTKQALIASVAPKYNELVKSFEESKNPLLDALARQGGDPMNIPIPDFKPFSMGDLGGAKSNSINPDKLAKYSALRSQGMSPEQARAAMSQ